MRRTFNRVALACALSALAPAQAQAQSAAAQDLFDQGRALMTKGKAAEACPKFEESQRLDPASGTLVNLARCYEATGRLASAWSTYLEGATAAHTSGNADREKVARNAAAALAIRLPRLRLNVPAEAAVDGLELEKDGAAVGQPQWGSAIPENPGNHTIIARAPGRLEWKTVAVVAGEGTTTDVAVPVLEKAPEETPGPVAVGAASEGRSSQSGLGTQRIAALVSGGVGVAGIAVGTIFWMRTVSKKNEAADHCNGENCRDEQGVNAGRDARSAGNVATVAMTVGGVGLAAGVALWFTAPKTEGPQTAFYVGPGSVRLQGSF